MNTMAGTKFSYNTGSVVMLKLIQTSENSANADILCKGRNEPFAVYGIHREIGDEMLKQFTDKIPTFQFVNVNKKVVIAISEVDFIMQRGCILQIWFKVGDAVKFEFDMESGAVAAIEAYRAGVSIP